MFKVSVSTVEKPVGEEGQVTTFKVGYFDEKGSLAWEALHELKSIIDFNATLKDKCNLDENIVASFEAFNESENVPTDKQTEVYLNQVLEFYAEKVWDTAEIMAFFDDGQEVARPKKSKSKGEQHKLALSDPDAGSKDFVDEGNKVLPSYSDKLNAMGKSLTRSDSFHSTDSIKVVSAIDGIPVCVTRTSSASDENQPTDPHLEPHYDTLEGVYDDERAAGWRLDGERNEDDEDEEELTAANLMKLNKSFEASVWSRIQANYNQRELTDSPYSSECELDMTEVDLSIDLLFLLHQAGVEGYHAEEVLYAITPKDNQIEYRNSVVSFMNRQIREAVNATGFGVGLHVLNANLPDDPIRMAVALCKKNLTNWQVSLADMLNLQTERHATGRLQYHLKAEEASSPSDRPLAVHLVTNTNSMLDVTQNYQVTCTIDGTMDVEVSATQCTSYALCMLVFFEEVALIVGQNNLLKRSVLMIRAWWQYETNPKRLALSDHVLWVMVISIFNQYAPLISTPLQALCLFLREYSNYDGSSQLITLQGIVPFYAGDTNRAQLIPPAPHHLVTEKLLDRCLTVLNCHDQQVSLRRAVKAVGAMPDGYRNTDGHFGAVDYVNHPNFIRKRWNVVDPFTLLNMMQQDKISQRAADRLGRTFRGGYQKMSCLLTPLANRLSDDYEISAAIKKFFTVTLSKFNEVYAPTVTRNDLLRMSMLQPNVPYPSPPMVWQSISYCKLIQEAVITEASIITLITETLARKGPVPVSEIGKALTEVTSINNIAQQLKERFGGLKKLLQRCSSIFLFSNDHPFNPHVMLRSTVTPDQMRQLEDGLFPGRLLNVKSNRNNSNSPAFGKSGSQKNSPEDPYSSGSEVDSPRMNRRKFLDGRKAGSGPPARPESPHGGGYQEQGQQYKFTIPSNAKTKPNPLLLSSLHNSLLKSNSTGNPFGGTSSPGGSNHGGSNHGGGGGSQRSNSRSGSPHSFSGGADHRSSPVMMHGQRGPY